MPKRIQLPDDFYKHDFKQLAKIEKHPRTRSNSSVKSNSLDVTGHFNDEIVMNLTILKHGQSINTIVASLGRGCISG
jgi:hypothetical protein